MSESSATPGHLFAVTGSFLFRYREGLFPFACLTVFLPGEALFADPLLAVATGLFVTLVGQFIRVATIGLEYIVRGGKNRRVYAEDLVTAGVYAHCRNPMYVGNLLILAGVAVGSNSWTCVLVAIPLFTLVYMAIVAAEEAFLRNKFGAAFDAYALDVPRWIPRWSGLLDTFAASKFHWTRVLLKEYGTPFGWIVGFAILTLWHLWRAGQIAERDALVQCVVVIVVLTVLVRLRIRYLKKSRRIVAD
jgi:protein-S-isoprenylcysteine O-methyltransferase Ste14